MNPSPCIEVSNLSKRFRFPVKDRQRSWLANLLRPERREIAAVDEISFAVAPGERIAFIGPNGAGKSTTIKMLTGILTPTSGSARVLGLDPNRDRKRLALRIGTVFGQRSQLLPNLPLTDSLEFYGAMYDLSGRELQDRITELVARFELGSFAGQPVRKLSLGQRMRGEIAASLIHRPALILLDEPTIGLDVVAKKALRDLLLQVNREQGTTLFLTSHDVGDIESMCDRTVIVNHGRIIRDLPTAELARTFAHEKIIELSARSAFAEFPGLPDGLRYAGMLPQRATIVADTSRIETKRAIRSLLDLFDVEDINVYHADLEAVIRNIYEKAAPRR